jgi:hypothetical protein
MQRTRLTDSEIEAGCRLPSDWTLWRDLTGDHRLQEWWPIPKNTRLSRLKELEIIEARPSRYGPEVRRGSAWSEFECRYMSSRNRRLGDRIAFLCDPSWTKLEGMVREAYGAAESPKSLNLRWVRVPQSQSSVIPFPRRSAPD